MFDLNSARKLLEQAGFKSIDRGDYRGYYERCNMTVELYQRNRGYGVFIRVCSLPLDCTTSISIAPPFYVAEKKELSSAIKSCEILFDDYITFKNSQGNQ